MSNISGVTFANQAVTPSDYGALWHRALGDGMLLGGTFGYGGSTLTMAAGYGLVCGRELRFPAGNQFVFSGLSSGYARVVLVLDLTQTSTVEQWQQGSFRLDYAAAEAAFLPLTQEELNAGGNIYECELCRVRLADSVIAEIISYLGPSASSGSLPISGGTITGDLSIDGILTMGTTKLNADSYGDELPATGTEGQLFFLKEAT